MKTLLVLLSLVFVSCSGETNDSLATAAALQGNGTGTAVSSTNSDSPAPSVLSLPAEILPKIPVPVISQSIPTNADNEPVLSESTSTSQSVSQTLEIVSASVDSSSTPVAEVSVATSSTVSTISVLGALTPETTLQVLDVVQNISPSLETQSTSTESAMSVLTGGGITIESFSESEIASDITSDIADKELNVSRCASYKQTLDTSDGLWYPSSQGGVESYWSNQNLWVTFNVCVKGYYRVTLSAKNVLGTLPTDYKSFEVSVVNKTLPLGYKNKKLHGTIEVSASDSLYRQSSTRIWLEPGANKLLFVWKNDVKLSDSVDTNILIKKIWLEPVVTNETLSLSLDGIMFCSLSGYNDSSQWTWKSDYIQTKSNEASAGYCFWNLQNKRYKISVTARNRDGATLPSSFKEWKLKASSEGVDSFFSIAASKDFKTGYTFLTIPWNAKKVNLTWIRSDSFSDVSLQIKSILLEESP
jgi:hypothetical protein